MSRRDLRLGYKETSDLGGAYGEDRYVALEAGAASASLRTATAADIQIVVECDNGYMSTGIQLSAVLDWCWKNRPDLVGREDLLASVHYKPNIK